MMRLLKTATALVTVLSLVACSSMNSGFDCPNKAGVNCKSLDEINRMVDSGQIREQSQSGVAPPTSTAATEFQPYPLMTELRGGIPLRYGETVQRLWIAPFEDTEGNYHDASLIYAVIKEGRWIGVPIKTVSQY